MMSDSVLRALVVDDEIIARHMVICALTNEGFFCDPALDGVDALERIEQTAYDLVVTDLCMPNKHGHALSVALLSQDRVPAPVIVVHSSVDDPRMTKDLLNRGVDDIVYKPTNYEAFAAKMKALVERRKRVQSTGRTGNFLAAVQAAVSSPESRRGGEATFFASIGIQEFDQRLARVKHMVPVSDVALEVLERVRADDSDAYALAALVARDGVLAAELLRLGNNGFYNRSERPITDLHEAIARVGTRRIGEIALAVSALGSLTEVVLPWFDKELARMRSLASCMAAQRILEHAKSSVSCNGIVFSALMHPLGRGIVGTAYPTVYGTLLAEAQRTAVPLRLLEQNVIPRSPSAATAHLLSCWGLPADVYAPLIHADISFDSLAGLAEPVRTSVKILKVAIVLGEFAVGRWMPWDTIDFPRANLLRELGIASPHDIIDEVRCDLKSLGSLTTADDTKGSNPEEVAGMRRKRIAYCRLSNEPFDIVPSLTESLGYELFPIPASEPYPDDNVLFNCLHSPVARLAHRHDAADDPRARVMLCNHEPPDSIQRSETIIRLPASYQAIQEAFKLATFLPIQSPASDTCEGSVGSEHTRGQEHIRGKLSNFV